jgi:Cytochrome c3
VKLFCFVLLVAGSTWMLAAAGQAGVSPVCARCHVQARTALEGPMARALEKGEDSAILKEHRQLTFSDGRFLYTIARAGDRSLYTVKDGDASLTVPIPWAFGLGAAGQTYALEMDGKWYESRVSFYKDIERLDFTLGARELAPRDLKEAVGREMTPRDVALCFGCHSTNGVHDGEVDFHNLEPGVLCESCHGSAANHVKAIETGAKAAPMPKLGALDSAAMSELCGRCHRTWEAIASNGPRGIPNVRFQPYRLTNSKCYDAVDQRISCVACHDVHAHSLKPMAFYDAKCTACHSQQANSPAKMCRVSAHDCVSCHMPKYEIPGSHHRFTDHEIRIATAGSPYPN